MDKNNLRDFNWLYQKYKIEKLSTRSIGEILNCYSSTVIYWIKKHNIEINNINIYPRSKGRNHSVETKKKISLAQKGKIVSEETKKLISLNHADISKEKNPMYGKKHSYDSKIKMSKNRGLKGKRGPETPNWKGEAKRKTDLIKTLRTCLEYINWRKKVFERDKYTCQNINCEKNCKILNADHIKPFSLIIKEQALKCEILWNINNGRTLCLDCHKKTETFAKRIS